MINNNYNDEELGPRIRARFGDILQEMIRATGIGHSHRRNQRGHGHDTIHQGVYSIARHMGDMGGYQRAVKGVVDGTFAEERYTRLLSTILRAIESMSDMSEDDICLRVPDADLLYSFCRGE